jgi:PEP-CTERM/exosortase A-associated glycosyltransferase
MRVLHVLHTSLPFICGYSIRSDYILRFQRSGGMEVGVVTSGQHPNGSEFEECVEGVKYWRTPSLDGRQFPLLRERTLMKSLERRIEDAVGHFKPDLIHAHSPMLVGLPAMAIARRHRIPFVYEVRDLWENASADRGRFKEGSPLYRLARLMETRVLKGADSVITICRALQMELAPRAGRTDKVIVVDNGVEAASFTPAENSDESKSRWNCLEKKTLAYVGTFQPYEGLDVLISALPSILSREPNAHLLITGSGGMEHSLRALVERLDLSTHVTFTGRIPHDEVHQIYEAADVMIYPRTLTRTTALTTPLKPLEAMAMGKAVAASDVPAMLELVEDGLTGITFRAGDAKDLAARCLPLLQSKAHRRMLGANAREWVLQERQWQDLVARYTPVYERLLHTSRRPAYSLKPADAG